MTENFNYFEERRSGVMGYWKWKIFFERKRTLIKIIFNTYDEYYKINQVEHVVMM